MLCELELNTHTHTHKHTQKNKSIKRNKTSGVSLEASCLQAVATVGTWDLGLLHMQLSDL